MNGLAAPVARTGRRALEIVQDSGRLGLFLIVGLARIFTPPYTLRPLLVPIATLYRRTVLRRLRTTAVVGSLGKTTATRALLRDGARDLSLLSQRGASANALREAAGVRLGRQRATRDRPRRRR